MCYVKKLYYYILHLLHLLLPGPPREFLGPKAKGNLAPPPILQIMILKLSPPRCVIKLTILPYLEGTQFS